MTKKEAKRALAYYKYKVIGPSWYTKDNKSILFNAYDDGGFCHEFYIDIDRKKAKRQMMTTTGQVLNDVDVTYMFWTDNKEYDNARY
jgi:hypothetical protein